MLRGFSRVAIALAVASASALTLTIGPADAATSPVWPVAGRLPTGCDPGVVLTTTSSTRWTYSYTDHSTPTITSLTFGVGASMTTVLPPAGKVVAFTAKVSNPCSGVLGGNVRWSFNGAQYLINGLNEDSTDSFNSTFVYSIAVTPDSAGAYRLYAAEFRRRYDAFTLDQDGKYISSTVGSTSVLQAGPWALRNNYLLRQTTLATRQSATRVRKGRTARIYGVLKYATDAGYAPDNGERVYAQVKMGTRWVTKATLTASSTGAVTYSFVPLRTTQVRLVHATVLSGRFTAAVISSTRTVVVG